MPTPLAEGQRKFICSANDFSLASGQGGGQKMANSSGIIFGKWDSSGKGEEVGVCRWIRTARGEWRDNCVFLLHCSSLSHTHTHTHTHSVSHTHTQCITLTLLIYMYWIYILICHYIFIWWLALFIRKKTSVCCLSHSYIDVHHSVVCLFRPCPFDTEL